MSVQDNTKHVRTARLELRLSVQERKLIERKAESLGMSLSDYIRTAALGFAETKQVVVPDPAGKIAERITAQATTERTWAAPPDIPPEMFEDSEDWQQLRDKAQAFAPKFKCPVCDKRFSRQIRCSCSNRLTVPA